MATSAFILRDYVSASRRPGANLLPKPSYNRLQQLNRPSHKVAASNLRKNAIATEMLRHSGGPIRFLVNRAGIVSHPHTDVLTMLTRFHFHYQKNSQGHPARRRQTAAPRGLPGRWSFCFRSLSITCAIFFADGCELALCICQLR